MSQTVLPNSINYGEMLPSISPSTQNFTQVLQPTNGSIFGQNQQIYVDIPSRGFIDPQSLYIRYRMNVGCVTANIAADTVTVIGCPVYTLFIRVETYILIHNKLIQSKIITLPHMHGVIHFLVLMKNMEINMDLDIAILRPQQLL